MENNLNKIATKTPEEEALERTRKDLMDDLKLHRDVLALGTFLRKKEGLLDDDQRETLRKMLIMAGADLNEAVEDSRSVLEELGN